MVSTRLPVILPMAADTSLLLLQEDLSGPPHAVHQILNAIYRRRQKHVASFKVRSPMPESVSSIRRSLQTRRQAAL